jgi:hypothetical protein
VPGVVGAKVTLIVQLDPGATLEPQLLVSPKFALTAMLEIFKLVLPVLDSVTGCAALVVPTCCPAKLSEVGLSVAFAEVAVPVRLAVCGLLLALSVTVRVAVRVPLAVGLKVTLIAQLAPAARLEPQLLVSAKSPLLVPVMAMLLMDSAPPLEFESVTVWGALVVPTDWVANVTELGERAAEFVAGRPPTPQLPGASSKA